MAELTLILDVDPASRVDAARFASTSRRQLDVALVNPEAAATTVSFRTGGENKDNLIKAARSGRIAHLWRAAGGAENGALEVWEGGTCAYQQVPRHTFGIPAMARAPAAELRAALRSVDVLMVTVTPVEKGALLARLRPLPGHPQILRGVLDENVYRVGQLGRYAVAHVQCTMGSLGRRAAALVVRSAIDEVAPKAIIAVGIAFGMSPGKQLYGDVLVAETIVPYESQKLTEIGAIDRGQPLPAGIVLSRLFSDLSEDWQLTRSRSMVTVHRGNVLSGEKLVNRRDFRDELARAYPTAIGGEMEGSGVYAAAQHGKTEVILVKAICDWADGTKDDGPQPFAALAAVLLTEHVLDQPDALTPLGVRDAGAQGADARRAGLASGSAPLDGVRFDVTIDAHLTALTQEQHDQILDMLKEVSGDVHLRAVRVRPGSAIYRLAASHEARGRLEQSVESGELGELLGVGVTAVTHVVEPPGPVVPWIGMPTFKTETDLFDIESLLDQMRYRPVPAKERPVASFSSGWPAPPMEFGDWTIALGPDLMAVLTHWAQDRESPTFPPRHLEGEAHWATIERLVKLVARLPDAARAFSVKSFGRTDDGHLLNVGINFRLPEDYGQAAVMLSELKGVILPLVAWLHRDDTVRVTINYDGEARRWELFNAEVRVTYRLDIAEGRYRRTSFGDDTDAVTPRALEAVGLAPSPPPRRPWWKLRRK